MGDSYILTNVFTLYLILKTLTFILFNSGLCNTEFKFTHTLNLQNPREQRIYFSILCLSTCIFFYNMQALIALCHSDVIIGVLNT